MDVTPTCGTGRCAVFLRCLTPQRREWRHREALGVSTFEATRPRSAAVQYHVCKQMF